MDERKSELYGTGLRNSRFHALRAAELLNLAIAADNETYIRIQLGAARERMLIAANEIKVTLRFTEK